MRRLLLLAFIWGWSFLFIKVAVEGLAPPAVAFGRCALGALVLVGTLRFRGRPLPLDRVMVRHYAVVAAFGNVLPFTMLAWGEQRITSALTAVLNASTTLFTAIASYFYLRDRFRPGQVVGLLLGFVGVAIAAGFGSGDLGRSSVLGSLASVGAGACYGVAYVYMRRHLTTIEPIVAATGQLLMATVLLAPFAIVASSSVGVHLTVRRLLALLALGVVGTGIAFLVNYTVVNEMGATKASLVTYLIPVVAVVVGVVVLGEPFEWRVLAGGVLIAAGIALVTQRRLRSAALAVAVLAVALVGCGDGGTKSASCEPAQREALDPNEGHVLPGSPEPTYRTDPPTSGPHVPAETPTGVLTQALNRPRQVGALEAGVVLLQYRDLTAADQQRLEALAGGLVVVAPNPELPDTVVATAWLFKQTCVAVDATALRAFATAHQGNGPGTDLASRGP